MPNIEDVSFRQKIDIDLFMTYNFVRVKLKYDEKDHNFKRMNQGSTFTRGRILHEFSYTFVSTAEDHLIYMEQK